MREIGMGGGGLLVGWHDEINGTNAGIILAARRGNVSINLHREIFSL